MDPMLTMRQSVRRLAVAGRVTDAVTGRPLAGALAQITTAPKEFRAWTEIRGAELASRTPPGTPPERAVSDADGWFRYLDLPAGKYTIDVSLPPAGSRYGAARAKTEVSAASAAAWVDASVSLPPTTVRGTVRDDAGLAVPMAEVKVKGSLETTYTDRDGAYTLVAVEAGARVLSVRARGFAPAEAAVKLAEGKQKTQDVALAPQP